MSAGIDIDRCPDCGTLAIASVFKLGFVYCPECEIQWVKCAEGGTCWHNDNFHWGECQLSCVMKETAEPNGKGSS